MAATPRQESQVPEMVTKTLRYPKEIEDRLKVLKLATGRTINELIVAAIADYLASKGRREMVARFLEEAREQFRVDLDKLKTM